jgi:hypothetical protein
VIAESVASARSARRNRVEGVLKLVANRDATLFILAP